MQEGQSKQCIDDRGSRISEGVHVDFAMVYTSISIGKLFCYRSLFKLHQEACKSHHDKLYDIIGLRSPLLMGGSQVEFPCIGATMLVGKELIRLWRQKS